MRVLMLARTVLRMLGSLCLSVWNANEAGVSGHAVIGGGKADMNVLLCWKCYYVGQ